MAESDLIRGNVDTVILKVLYEGDRYGYDLIKQINARSEGQWEIKQPTVYACLKRLEKQGFVSSYWDSSESDGGRRKYYSLTESGKEVFIKYKNEFERANALFGGIISGEQSVFIQPTNDFSDVEDEGYSVPKRRTPRPKRPAQEKKPEPVVTEDTAQEFNDDYIADELGLSDNKFSGGEFIQDDLFSSIAEDKQYEDEFVDEFESNSSEQTVSYDNNTETIEEAPAARTALDPRSIIDRYYASETGESYSDIHGKTVYTDAPQEQKPAVSPDLAPQVEQNRQPVVATEEQPQQPTTSNALAVAQNVEPAPIPNKQPAPAMQAEDRPAVRNSDPMLPLGFEEEESPARKEYKTVLSDLVERFEVAPPVVKRAAPSPHEEQAAVASGNAYANDRFTRVTQAARELGNEVTVKSHNDSAKQYNHKYYYYSSRLMFTHYFIMCVAMLVIGTTLFFTFYTGLDLRIKYDNLLYIAAGLLPIIMFLTAVINFVAYPGKTKRINVNFRSSLVIRCVIMIQVAVVVYCLNIIWGMPVAFSAAYLPSLMIPLVYALFIPLSEVIFMTLLKSEHYAVE